MIEKMKVVHIVAAQTQKTELLDALRALGIVHFAEKADADQTYLERFAALSRLITVLEEQGVSEVEAETLDDVKFKQLYDGLNACLERKKALEAERAAAVSACDTLAGWGSFSPAEIKELKAQGFELHFCRVDKKLLASLEADKEVRFLRLAPVGKQQTVAILGALPASCTAGEFIPPEKSLDEYRQEIADCERGLSECGAQLKAAAKHLPSFREQLLKTQNDADYSSVRNTSESGDGLVWLTGYLPVDEAERFKAAAAKEHWAWAMDDPAADDDKVPTKIKYTKVTGAAHRAGVRHSRHRAGLPRVRYFVLVPRLLHALFRHDHRRRGLRLPVPADRRGPDGEEQEALRCRAAFVGALHRHHRLGRDDRHLVRA